LLVKRDACFVHGLTVLPSSAGSRRGLVERVVSAGHVLLHTSRETGKMIRLGEATGVVAVNTRRISYVATRTLGVVADEERLYALLWTSGRLWSPPAGDAAVPGGRYALRVFWLADGAPLPAPHLDPSDLPDAAPPASLGAGPLEVVEGGVSCFGTTARYDGRTLRTR
jgi:hypothetical protein